MSQHELKLATEPFEAIVSGRKTIESRLYDDKRQQIQLGDTIVFTNREKPEQTVTVRVVGLLRYQTFESLFARNEPTKFSGPDKDWLLSQIHEFYSLEDEHENGVIGIEFELL